MLEDLRIPNKSFGTVAGNSAALGSSDLVTASHVSGYVKAPTYPTTSASPASSDSRENSHAADPSSRCELSGR